MSLWTKLKNWFTEDGKHFVSEPIPKPLVDAQYEDAVIVAERGYLRVWIVEMFLAKSRDWFTNWQPAVHGKVKLSFADQQREFTRLAAPAQDKFLTNNAVLANYVLLDLVPFRGGLVEIDATLLALKGADQLSRAIGVVASFADLVVPPLGDTLEIASKVKEGIAALFGDADEVHLALHNTFGGAGGANQLRAGYVAVVRATDQQIERKKLCVKNDRLCYGDFATAVPLAGVDYILLRIEAAPSRDDIEQFSDVAKLRAEAVAAYLANDNETGDAAIAAALARAATHPDLINADRRALGKLVRADVAEYKDGGNGATAAAVKPWHELVKGFVPSKDHSPVSIAELLGP